jgi:hypothetical protein
MPISSSKAKKEELRAMPSSDPRVAQRDAHLAKTSPDVRFGDAPDSVLEPRPRG